MAGNILIIEDKGSIISLLQSDLAQKGYSVSRLSRSEALTQVGNVKPHLIVLDVGPSPMEIAQACHDLRNLTPVPIIALCDEENDVGSLEGVEYVLRPPDSRELLSCIETALSRQVRRRRARYLKAGALILDVQTRSLSRGEKQYHLRPKEFELLRLFMTNVGKILTRKQIMHEVWETDYTGNTDTLYVYVRWLREKLEDDPSTPIYLQTVRGTGYRFDVPKPDSSRQRSKDA